MYKKLFILQGYLILVFEVFVFLDVGCVYFVYLSFRFVCHGLVHLDNDFCLPLCYIRIHFSLESVLIISAEKKYVTYEWLTVVAN